MWTKRLRTCCLRACIIGHGCKHKKYASRFGNGWTTFVASWFQQIFRDFKGKHGETQFCADGWSFERVPLWCIFLWLQRSVDVPSFGHGPSIQVRNEMRNGSIWQGIAYFASFSMENHLQWLVDFTRYYKGTLEKRGNRNHEGFKGGCRQFGPARDAGMMIPTVCSFGTF